MKRFLLWVHIIMMGGTFVALMWTAFHVKPLSQVVLLTLLAMYWAIKLLYAFDEFDDEITGI
jgi:hypothetical protein